MPFMPRFAERALPILAIIAIVGLAYLPVTTALIGQGDFPTHIRIAENLARGVVQAPHVLFHVAVAVTMFAGAPPVRAAIAVIVVLQVIASLLVFWYLRTYTAATPFVAAILAILLLAVGPILPPGADRSLYMTGHFLPNGIHNPTVIAAKAFVPALLAIGTSAAGLTPRPLLHWAAAAPAVIAAGLAKPHYVSCVLPASLGWACVRALSRHDVPWRLMGLGLVLPAAAVILWTYIGNTELGEGGSPIFAPLRVLRHYVPVDAVSILQRLVSDIAFPLTIAIAWPSALLRFPPLMLAWLAYAVALAQGGLLAESGPKLLDGNFMWSSQLATFALMTASAAYLSDAASPRRFGVRAAAAWGVLLLHVVNGISWAIIRMDN